MHTGSPLLRIYRLVRPAVLTPSAGLAEAIVEMLVIASCGLHDLSGTSIFNGLHGTAAVFRGDTLLHVAAAWALRVCTAGEGSGSDLEAGGARKCSLAGGARKWLDTYFALAGEAR
jgi:hypothetical protein